jgi:hypothetical protein
VNRVMIPMLTTTMMTPMERAAGRFMRAPDHPTGNEPPAQGGNEPPASGNNTGGNGDGTGNVTPNGDNTGGGDELATFWGDGNGEEPNAESLTPEQEKEQQTALGTELKTAIESFAPPAPVFTQETAEQIAAGNFDGINSIMAKAHQATIQQSLLLTSKLVGAVVKRMQSDFDQRINSNLGARDDNQFLQSEFPLAKDPAFAPMVTRVWGQALKNSKGDRQAAIRMTRGMLEAFGEKANPGLREAAADPTAGINSAASRSLVESLLDRG